MSSPMELSEFELKLEQTTLELKNCQKQKEVNTCMKCEKILDCDTQRAYVESVYDSMSDGKAVAQSQSESDEEGFGF